VNSQKDDTFEDDTYKDHEHWTCKIDLLGQGRLDFVIRNFTCHNTGDCHGAILWTLVLEIAFKGKILGLMELECGVGDGYSNRNEIIFKVSDNLKDDLVQEIPKKLHGRTYTSWFVLFACVHRVFSELNLDFDRNGSKYLATVFDNRWRKMKHVWKKDISQCLTVDSLFAFSDLHKMVWLWLFTIWKSSVKKWETLGLTPQTPDGPNGPSF